MNELPPCPFCGGTNLHKSRRFEEIEIFRVGCNSCGALVEADSKANATAAWLRRAHPAPAGEPQMPEPDTHCFDDDTGRDVWSHSPDQLRAYGDAMAEAARREQAQTIATKNQQLDNLLQHCPDAECMTCGEVMCPHGEPLHFHHDGCPACYQQENTRDGAAQKGAT